MTAKKIPMNICIDIKKIAEIFFHEFGVIGNENKTGQIYFYSNSSIATTGTVDWQCQGCG